MNTYRIAIAASILGMTLACHGTESERTPTECAGGECDDLADVPDSQIVPSPCDAVFIDKSGAGHARIVNRNGDWLTNLFQSACPTSWSELATEIKKHATEACDQRDIDAGRYGIQAGFTSETAGPAGHATTFRASAFQRCGHVFNHHTRLAFIFHNIDAEAEHAPEEVFVIASRVELDDNGEVPEKTDGIMNFYRLTGDAVEFHGNSWDMMTTPTEEATDNHRLCAGCHPNGSMIMRESARPYLHWEADPDEVYGSYYNGSLDVGQGLFGGVRDLYSRLFRKNTNVEFAKDRIHGPRIAGMVAASNTDLFSAIQERGFARLGARSMFRPLFCSDDIEIDAMGQLASPVLDDSASKHTVDALEVHPFVNPFVWNRKEDHRFERDIPSSIAFDANLYMSRIVENGQRVLGLADAEGNPARDAMLDFPFIERSHSAQWRINRLGRVKRFDPTTGDSEMVDIVGEEFIRDVLLVDFTRPVFSEDRCSLLDFVPDFTADELNPAGVDDDGIPELVRQRFLAELGNPAPGTPAAELKQNLEQEGGHHEHALAFWNECANLPSSDLLQNAMEYVSHTRNLARQQPILDPSAGSRRSALPVDDLETPAGTRLHPTTCEPTTEFVPVTQ